MRAPVDSISIGAFRSPRLWVGTVIGATLAVALVIFQPPALVIVLGGTSLWLVFRRRAGHQPSLLMIGVLVGMAIVFCLAVVSILVHQGSPSTGHGTGRG